MSVVTFTLANEPAGYCWPGTNQYGIDLISRLTGSVETGSETNVYIGANIPPVDAQGVKIWVRLVNGYLEGIYWYIGAWLRPHPIPASSNTVQLWKGTEAQLTTYDGGDALAVGDSSGPMWQIDTDFQGRFPYGVGTGAANPALGGTGGATTIPGASVPNHVHTIGAFQTDSGAYSDDPYLLTGTSTLSTGSCRKVTGASDLDPQVADISAVAGVRIVSGLQENETDPADTSILPPYRGVYFIKRSARKYYKVSA